MTRLMRFLTGFVIGMSLGAAIVMILAPQSGEEARGLILSQVEGILEEGRKAAEQTRLDAHARLAALKEGRG
jgi:gas vesicle protein